MKVLITSGGTKIPIDSVRHIGNMSNGTLGAKLAKSALIGGNEVFFFRAEKSKSPMSVNVDLMNQSMIEASTAFQETVEMAQEYGHKYTEITYKTFDDYQTKLPQIIALYKPDVIILAAAVSDYAPETVVNGKIRTKDNLNIPLVPLPKVISSVRGWAGDKAKIIGFKLLVDVSQEELIGAAFDSLKKNRLDLVCANDLRTILNGEHMLHLVFTDGSSAKTRDTALWGDINAMF